MGSFHELFEVIGVLARKRYQTTDRCLSTVGLNHTEARLLSLLSHSGGTAMQESLSNMLLVDRTNAGRALKRLEQDGYVSRKNDLADKRANLVRISSKGRKAVMEISKLRKRIIREFFGELTEQEAREIVGLLRKALTPEERAKISSNQREKH